MPTQSPALLAVALAVALMLPAPGSSGRATVAQAGQGQRDGYGTALERGERALAARRFEEALDAFKEANKLRDKKAVEALYGLCRAYYGFGAFKDADKACAEALEYVGDDQRLTAILHHERGLALAARARNNKDKVLREAEEEFRTVVAMTADLPIAWYNLGAVVLRQGRDADGIAALTTYLDLGLDAPEAGLARRMIENPRRAREPAAADFSFASLEGEHIRLEDLQGKTVLLDFWGMWCPPCRAATPQLVRLYRKFSDEAFVMIGFSSDPVNKKRELLEYIDEHGMTWPQYLDANRAIHRAYDIEAFPTYVVVDGEGLIIRRIQGWNSTATIRQLDAAVRKGLEAATGAGDRQPPLLPLARRP